MVSSIFLIHSSLDKDFVRELHKSLEENGIKSWIDEAEIKIGDTLSEKISEGIEESNYIAIILSPNSINSSWAKAELKMAITREIENNTKILPILIEDCEIPLYLRSKLYGDFKTPTSSIKSIRDLIKLLKENKKMSKTEDDSSLHEDNKKEYNRYKEIYDVLSSHDILMPPRFNEKSSKSLAELFCKMENYNKFKDFIYIIDDLTFHDILMPSKFNLRDAVKIALERLHIKFEIFPYFPDTHISFI